VALGPGALGPGTVRAHKGWEATLALTLRRDRDGTSLARARHVGPLRVQRPFYPEGQAGPCHVYVLHPPGGVVSGDRLTLDVMLEADAAALLTAPGASKLYRARDGQAGSIHVRHRIAAGAVCEWLPPETIVYDGACGQLHTAVQLDPDGVYAGWEILCFGRPAAGECFTHGVVHTELAVRRAGKLQYLERGLFRGGDPMLTAPWGLAGKAVAGTFMVAAPSATESWVGRLREALSVVALDAGDLWAATLVSGVLVVRYRGGSTRAARLLFERALHVLRPLYAGRAAVHPRIWST
jgi:urease accessory protein